MRAILSHGLVASTLAGVLALASAAQDLPAVSFEHLTVGASAVGLSAATRNPTLNGVPRAAQRCTGIVETADIRLRIDGAAATASVGQLAQVGAVVDIRGADNLRRLSAIRTGGTSGALPLTCYPTPAEAGAHGLTITPTAAGASTTGTGAEVHAVSPAITTPTITTPAITGGGSIAGTFTGQPTFSGQVFARESFDQPHLVREEDFTAKVVTDNGIMVVFGSPAGVIKYHEEVTKTASSWLEVDGLLNIAGDDDADNEGVEIFLGDEDDQATGWIVAGTSGACFTASVTVTDISGTDQFLIGWRQNEAFNATNTYTAYSDWSVVGINNVDGSIFSLAEVEGGGTLSDDSGVNAADGDTWVLRSCILASGVRTAERSADLGATFTTITLVNGVTAHTAGDQMSPFITYLSAGTDGGGPRVNWFSLSALP